MTNHPVAIALGFDEFEASLIVGTVHRLLVDANDADAARLIVNDFRGS